MSALQRAHLLDAPNDETNCQRIACRKDRIASFGKLIEVALDQRLPPTDASRPELQIGDERIRRSVHPEGRLDRLVFLVPRAQFDRMAQDAPLQVRAHGRSSATMASAPRLDKSKVVTP